MLLSFATWIPPNMQWPKLPPLLILILSFCHILKLCHSSTWFNATLCYTAASFLFFKIKLIYQQKWVANVRFNWRLIPYVGHVLSMEEPFCSKLFLIFRDKRSIVSKRADFLVVPLTQTFLICFVLSAKIYICRLCVRFLESPFT